MASIIPAVGTSGSGGGGSSSTTAESVYPEVFGAAGNGTTADTAAVQAAVNASGSGRRAVLTRAYRVTSPISMPSGSHLHLAPGSALIRDFAGGGNGSGTVVNSDQTGGNTDIAVTGTGRIYSASSTATGKHVSMVSVTKLRLQDFAIDSIYGDWAFTLKDCTKVQVSGIRSDAGTGSLATDGLHIYGGSDITVSDCIIRSGDDAISLTVENATNGWIEDVTISNCVLESSNASGIKMHANAPATTGIRRVLISNCTITQGSVGVAMWLRDTLTAGSSVYDITIDGLTINAGAGTNDGVHLQTISKITLRDVTVVDPSGRPIYLNGGSRITIENPRVSGQRGAGQHNIRVDGSTDVVIRGGSLLGATSNGIMLGSSANVSDVLVHGVTIDGATGTGVRIVNGTRVRVARCRVKNCASGYIEDAGGTTTTGTVVDNNDLRGNTGQPGSVTGSDIIARNNAGVTAGAAATPALIVTGASYLNPTQAPWPAANRAVFSRFQLAVDTPLRYVLWRCDVSSGNVQVGIVRLSGTDHGTFTRLAHTGVIACPAAGDIRSDLGVATYVAGDYAAFLWADNTTFQTRTATASVLPSQRIVGIASSLTTGVITSGPFSWNNQYTVLSVEADV